MQVSGTTVRPVLLWTGGLVLALSMLAALFWLAFQPDRADRPNRIATPDVPPGIAEDLTILVGKRAPSFTLPDDQAVARTVTPGQGRPIVLIMHMGILWQPCVGQLGELAKSEGELQKNADVYVINPDPPARAGQLRTSTGLTSPLLSDPGYTMAQQFGLRGSNRPMGGLVGFVIIDPRGVIRVQRVDTQFGRRAGYILGIVRRLREST